MPGRNLSNDKYRYGFNGKEKDKDITTGDLDFGERIYDGRLGRWLSVDPLQQKFAGLSPYNYCYNSPLKYVDPDGKLGIIVDLMYDEKTKGYTVLKITIKADVAYNAKASAGFMNNAHYNDYIQINKYTPRKDNPTPALETDVKLMDERTTTFFRMDGYANNKVNDGVYEGYQGGIMWTSEDQTGGSEETRISKPDAIVSIDGLATLLTRGAQAAATRQEFGDLGKTVEFIDKLFEVIKENTDKDPKADLSSSLQQKLLFAELEKLLPNNNPSNTPKEPIFKNYPKPGIKPNTVVNFGPSNAIKINDSTFKKTNKPATDTSPVWKGYKGKPIGTTTQKKSKNE